jgi:hypothetical protein
MSKNSFNANAGFGGNDQVDDRAGEKKLKNNSKNATKNANSFGGGNQPGKQQGSSGNSFVGPNYNLNYASRGGNRGGYQQSSSFGHSFDSSRGFRGRGGGGGRGWNRDQLRRTDRSDDNWPPRPQNHSSSQNLSQPQQPQSSFSMRSGGSFGEILQANSFNSNQFVPSEEFTTSQDGTKCVSRFMNISMGLQHHDESNEEVAWLHWPNDTGNVASEFICNSGFVATIEHVDFNIKIKSSDKSVPFHSFVSSLCPNLFEVSCDYSSSVLSAYRTLLYEGTITMVSPMVLIQVLEMCLRLELNNLVNLCFGQRRQEIHVNNFVELFSY